MGHQFKLSQHPEGFTISACLAVVNHLREDVDVAVWGTTSRGAGAADFLTVAIPLPSLTNGNPYGAALKHLRVASSFFLDGHYATVVSECRLALEGLTAVDGRDGEPVFGESPGARRAMSKTKRLAMIEAATHHFAHLAHHHSEDGPEVFSRSDASLILAATAALLNSAVARWSANSHDATSP